MKHLIPAALAAVCSLAAAETPREIEAAYAATAGAAYKSSAERGASLFIRKFGVSSKLDACTSCHTDKPGQPGRHVVTGKDIKPLSPAANAERLSDPAKVEKWFRRNCKEVVGRECTPGEKADFVAFLTEGR